MPLRFVKCPYGEHDEQNLKRRQKRMHWGELQEVKDEQGKQERQREHAKRAGEAKKKARAEAKAETDQLEP